MKYATLPRVSMAEALHTELVIPKKRGIQVLADTVTANHEAATSLSRSSVLGLRW